MGERGGGTGEGKGESKGKRGEVVCGEGGEGGEGDGQYHCFFCFLVTSHLETDTHSERPLQQHDLLHMRLIWARHRLTPYFGGRAHE